MKEISVEILPNGEVRFTRLDLETNKHMLSLLLELAPSKEAEIKRFLNGSESIQVIFGSEPLCG